MKVLDSIAQQASNLAAIRRDIHAHPELAFNENRTADIVARELERGCVVFIACDRGDRYLSTGVFPA